MVVGDLMLDRYWWGSVERISPEAPVPIVKLQRTSAAAGGAANVAANIAGLGSRAVLIGVTGSDTEGNLLRNVLAEIPNVELRAIALESRPTTVKTRIIAHSQQVTRLDHEDSAPISGGEEAAVLEQILGLIDAVDVLVVSDYAKGLLTDNVLNGLIASARLKGKMVFIDPKGKDYSKYRGATMVTPNHHEAADACGLSFDDPELVAHAGRRLIKELELEASLITEGANGMTLFESNGPSTHLNARARKVFDVTGAGDTVIATLAVAAAAGNSLADSAQLANIAAGIAVGQVGTAIVSSNEVLAAYNLLVN
ncbi:MAG: D-glycero-beta-D-manno-heptose-7-phosphate kinase [Chloracidobacterium sp.]|nr:D-glycero-beta-D-manno-heptose-7-phosphate kinase [Chloracidobacterium sp.]